MHLPVIKNLNGIEIFVRKDTPDLEVARSCLGDEFRVEKHLLSKINKKFIIFDFGGYIGAAAIFFSSIPNATIITLEPSPENFRILKLNTLTYSNIIAINAAIGPQIGQLEFFSRNTGEWGHTLISNPKDCQNPDSLGLVEVLTVEYLIDKYCVGVPIGLCKIDIEGGEVELLKNADWISKVPIVTAELHDRITNGCSTSWENMVRTNDNRIDILTSGEKKISVDCDLLTNLHS